MRNRAKELAELLSDSDRIRQERRKARANKSKYGGIEGGAGSSFSGGFSSSSSGRYGGFGSDSAGGGKVSCHIALTWRLTQQCLHLGYGADSVSDFYRSGSGAGGSSSATRRDSFEEYDAGDDDDRVAAPSSSRSRNTASASKPNPAPPKQKEVNLFDFDDDDSQPAPTPAPKAAPAAAPAASVGLDGEWSTQKRNAELVIELQVLADDFDDFQTATPAASVAAAPGVAAAPRPTSAASGSAAAKPSFFDMMNAAPVSASTSPAPQQSARPAMPQQGFSSFTSSSSAAQGQYTGMRSPPLNTATPMSSSSAFAPMAPAAQKPSGGQAPAKPANAFDDIWSMAGGTSSSSASKSGAGAGKSMAVSVAFGYMSS